MYAALAVEEFSLIVQRNEGGVPNIRTDVEPATAVALERDKLLRRHIIAGKRQRHDRSL